MLPISPPLSSVDATLPQQERAEEPPSRRQRLKRRLLRPAVVVMSLTIGAGIGLGGWQWRQPEGLPHGSESPAPATGEPDPAAAYAEIDQFIEAGNYARASRLCRELDARGAIECRELVQYRLALCREGSGEWDQAIEAYAGLTKAEKPTALTLAARFGQARCLTLAGRWTDATAALHRLAMIAADPAWAVPDVAAEIAWWQAIRQLLSYRSAPSLSPINPQSAASADIRSPVQRYIRWAAGHPAQTHDDGGNFLRVSLQPGELSRPRMWARLPTRPVRQQIADLGTHCGLRVSFTAAAEHRLGGEHCAIWVEGMPAANLLTALTESWRLTWTLRGRQLEIDERDDEEPPAAEQRLRLRAALEDALSRDPDHAFALPALLELANLCAEENRLADAAEKYESLIAEAPDESILRLAEYNLGLVRLRNCDYEIAREMLLSAVDRAPKDDLAGLAWWFIGRTHLDAADTQAAMHPLRMAASSSSVLARAAAAQGLCAARLYRGDDAEAHAALTAGPRAALRKEPFRAETMFLDAFARSRLARKSRPQSLTEKEDLLWSLIAQHGPPALGPIGTWLECQAMRELGLERRMAEYLEAVLPDCTGPLAARMVVLLAEHYLRAGNSAAAKRWLATPMRLDRSVIEYQLLEGELALREGKAKECLAICRRAAAVNPDQRPAILRLMGRAYEALGDSARAADCFAGRLADK